MWPRRLLSGTVSWVTFSAGFRRIRRPIPLVTFTCMLTRRFTRPMRRFGSRRTCWGVRRRRPPACFTFASSTGSGRLWPRGSFRFTASWPTGAWSFPGRGILVGLVINISLPPLGYLSRVITRFTRIPTGWFRLATRMFSSSRSVSFAAVVGHCRSMPRCPARPFPSGVLRSV